MYSFFVRTASSIEYNFVAKRFEISYAIVHFYDDDGEIVWVIKDWVAFRCVKIEDEEELSPDEFYEKLSDK